MLLQPLFLSYNVNGTAQHPCLLGNISLRLQADHTELLFQLVSERQDVPEGDAFVGQCREELAVRACCDHPEAFVSSFYYAHGYAVLFVDIFKVGQPAKVVANHDFSGRQEIEASLDRIEANLMQRAISLDRVYFKHAIEQYSVQSPGEWFPAHLLCSSVCLEKLGHVVLLAPLFVLALLLLGILLAILVDSSLLLEDASGVQHAPEPHHAVCIESK